MSDPIETANKILADIRENIRRIYRAIAAARRDEVMKLTNELRIARKQEREAKKYV